MLLPNPQLTCDERCSSPFKPSSGCTVCTKEVVREAEFAIKTFQQQHENAPVCVIGDNEAISYLKRIEFVGPVDLTVSELKVPEKVQRRNDYHRADAISLKMDVLDRAVKAYKDSVFFDADMVFLKPLTGPEDCEVAVSHNLSCVPADKDAQMHGAFNAGLVWTCNPKFANWWKQIYLRGDGFYEQVGLNLSPRMFRTGYFSLVHNYGFWRGPLGDRRAQSIHVHLDKELDATMPKFMHISLQELRADAWKRINVVDPEVAKMGRKIFKHPSKVFFVHYGKAGGVYVGRTLVRHVIPDYKEIDSWSLGFNRDWNPEELRHIITAPDNDLKYLHQHHVNLTTDELVLAKIHGWHTFTFLRDPREVIASLYHFRKDNIRRDGVDPIFFEPKEMSFKEFWEKVVTAPEHKKLWSLPPYIALIDEIDLFSHANLCKLTDKWFGCIPAERPKKNVSSNPGFRKLIETGHLTDDMLFMLEDTEEYKAFMRRCPL